MAPTLPDLNSHLSCRLCSGYLINATTIVDCFHSFCKSCLIKQLEVVANKCPVCKISINQEESFSSLRYDSALQLLTYKLVPQLFAKENERRQAFYKEHPEDEIHNELDRFKEQNLFYDLRDLIDITIEYLPKSQTSQHPLALLDDSPSIASSAKRRFLRVECNMKISHLKKWIKLKFGLPFNQRVVLLVDNEILPDSYQMVDLAYIFSKMKRPLNLYFYYCKISTKKSSGKRKLDASGKEEVLSGKKIKLNGKLGSPSKVSTNCGKSTNGRGPLSTAACKVTPNGKATPNGKTTPNGKATPNSKGTPNNLANQIGKVTPNVKATPNGKATPNSKVNGQTIPNGKSPATSKTTIGNAVKSNGTKHKATPNGAASKVVSSSDNLPNGSSSVLTVLDRLNKSPNRTALDKTKSNSSTTVQTNGTKAKKKTNGLPPNSSNDRNTRKLENSQPDKNPINKTASNGLASDTNSRTSNSMNGRAVSASLNGGRAQGTQPNSKESNSKESNSKESNDLNGSKTTRKRSIAQPTNSKSKRQQVGGTKV